MNGVVVADVDRVGQRALAVGIVGVVPQTIDKLAAHIAIAEQEAVEGVQAGTAVTLAPDANRSTFVVGVGGTLIVASVTCRLTGEGNLEDGVVVVDDLVVALVDKHVLVIVGQLVGTALNDRVGILHGRAVVAQVVLRTLHRAVGTGITLVRAQRVTAGSQGDAGNECMCKLLGAALHGGVGGRCHAHSSLLQVGNQGLLNLLTVGHRQHHRCTTLVGRFE